MVSYEQRVIETRRTEFAVPSSPYGACWSEVMKAISVAHNELREMGLVEEGADASDDQIRIRPGDDDVVVYYEVERDMTSSIGWRTV